MRAANSRPHKRVLSVMSILCLFLSWCLMATSASALAPGVGGPKTTIVVFSDRPIAESAWASLFTELRKEAAAEASKLTDLDAEPVLERGVDVALGQLVDNPIVVKLHGNCAPPIGVLKATSDAPLGWVRREEGRISPFIQVDCTRIAQLISPRVLWMNGRQKSEAMAVALARVILHEWVHIAGQTEHHSRKGILKPRFGWEDLLGGFDPEVSSSEPARQKVDKAAMHGLSE